jgi:hypothetical protein
MPAYRGRFLQNKGLVRVAENAHSGLKKDGKKSREIVTYRPVRDYVRRLNESNLRPERKLLAIAFLNVTRKNNGNFGDLLKLVSAEVDHLSRGERKPVVKKSSLIRLTTDLRRMGLLK